MDSFIEICQEAAYCMRYPQQDSVGWFLWIAWGLILIFIIGGFVGSWQVRHHVLRALREPTEYRGRMGREEFLIVYFGLQTLRMCVLVGTGILAAVFGKTLTTVVICLVGLALLGWLTAALYSTIVKRGHDFAFDGNESLEAYICSWGRRAVFVDEKHTWSVLCNQKGNPYANRFGSAPQENNYLIPPEKDWNSENREFPNVWDEADWQSMNHPEPKKFKRSRWEYLHR